MSNYIPRSAKTNKHGFALVASLSIMSVLVLIAVALFSLATVASRNAEISAAQIAAQANAKTALMIALGKMQAELGPDQRITANAAILDSNPETEEMDNIAHPHWLGSWDSWVAGDSGRAPVNVNYPSEPSHHQTLGNDLPDESMHPNYDQKNDHFRSWLVSLAPEFQTDILIAQQAGPPGSPRPRTDDTSVRLVGEGSLGPNAENADYVTAGLIDISDDGAPRIGRYGWWIGDESQKATILADSYNGETSLSDADRVFRAKAPATSGNKVLPGLSGLTDENQLGRISTLKSLDLLNLSPQPGISDPQLSQLNFHNAATLNFGVFSDVREGGLKRDLSTLLERPINPEDVYELEAVDQGDEPGFSRATEFQPDGEDYVLYRLNELGETTRNGNPMMDQATVPIQDLAAYYQLYDSFRPDWREGVKYASNIISDGIQVQTPDYGTELGEEEKFLREYTALYRNYIPIKFQIMLSYITVARDPADIQEDINNSTDPNFVPDTHTLKIGLTPAVTIWNPNNVPLALNNEDENKYPYMFRPRPVPMEIQFFKNEGQPDEVVSNPGNLRSFFSSAGKQAQELFTMYIGATEPIYLEPGESKVLSFAFTSDEGGGTNEINFSKGDDSFKPRMEGFPGWDPTKFLLADQSPEVLTFKTGDNISGYVRSATTAGNGERYNQHLRMRMIQKSRQSREAEDPTAWSFTQWGVHTRETRGFTGRPFADAIINQAIPQQGQDIILASRSADSLISLMGNDLDDPTDDTPLPFLYVGFKASTETHEDNNAGFAGGRKFTSRPFLHSSQIPPTFLDVVTGRSLYNFGWNWWIESVNSVFEAPVEITTENQGFYGGGYTVENGTTHVVQQHLPLVPPISIASLSHAHLGGFSIATEPPTENFSALRYSDTNYDNYQRVTATGYAGLGPHTLQAIGNSYAHPFIEADKTHTTWPYFFLQGGHNNPQKTLRPFADHSYLANKAIWDEFFFSSITPKPEDVVLFGSSADQGVAEVARSFFFDEGNLPNRRIRPSNESMSENRLNDLLQDYGLYSEGFADKIAAHLVIEGPFNVNSTSVTAWEAVLSSLKDKEVAYLDKDSPSIRLDIESRVDGTPIAAGATPNDGAYSGSTDDPAEIEQWTGWRVLSEDEIEELAEAIVEQVKLRGPFLSLSEFVNRRLDGDRPELSVKGALQSALDDLDVSINEGFRDNLREFSNSEINEVSELDNIEAFTIAEDPGGPVFPEALEGPVAYGSSAYVDQADILRHFAAQLTPRGDTFVIRAYGDTFDASGNVIARAWCEAIVQRLPSYLSPEDEDHVSVAELTSETNRLFGRKFRIINFRWMKNEEI